MKIAENIHFGFRIGFLSYFLLYLLGILWFRNQENPMMDVILVAFLLFLVIILPHKGGLGLLSIVCSALALGIGGSRLFGFFLHPILWIIL